MNINIIKFSRLALLILLIIPAFQSMGQDRPGEK